jgi:RimJ/RimL family protein N-acetyltransferase
MAVLPEDIELKELTEDDLGHMLRWLTDDRLLMYYDGRDTVYDEVSIREDYLDPLPPDSYRKIVLYRGEPVGYIQIFFADEELREEYCYSSDLEKVYAADMFIGVPEYWNMGMGTAMIEVLCAWLREERGAQAVILDPRKNNPRSIHVYGKCGFVQIGELPEHEIHEGEACDCILMERRL